MEKQTRIFIICPVRNVKQEINDKIAAYVAKLESEGNEVYWPYRDNPRQTTDPIGREIISYNFHRMIKANEIHIWYDKNSTSSVFDLGMFYTLLHTEGSIKFIIINRTDVEPTFDKSFENVILDFEKQYGH